MLPKVLSADGDVLLRSHVYFLYFLPRSFSVQKEPKFANEMEWKWRGRMMLKSTGDRGLHAKGMSFPEWNDSKEKCGLILNFLYY